MEAYVIRNRNGLWARILSRGAVAQSLFVPDRDGKLRDVLLGYDTEDEYKAGTCYFGAIIGRNGNRIANGQVTIDGAIWQMDKNEKGNNLHSGFRGADTLDWTADPQEDPSAIKLRLQLADGEQGLPGNTTLCVTYRLGDDNTFSLSYKAVSDKKTLINPTSHMYFNLKGHDRGSIEDHVVKLWADEYCPMDEASLPLASRANVFGTPFDFRAGKTVGEGLAALSASDSEGTEAELFAREQLRRGGGIDHHFPIRGDGDELRPFARAYAPESGICLDFWAARPGMQFYSGNYITDQTGKGGCTYHFRSGFCFEPQVMPDAVNRYPEGDPECPLLPAGAIFRSKSLYRFSVLPE